MMGHSHSLLGACTGLAAGILLHRSLPVDAALSGYTAGMALIPDLDSCSGSAAHCLGFISGAVAHVIRRISGGHRHASHSAVGIAIFTALAWLACRYRHDWGGIIGLGLLLTIAVSSGLEALSRKLKTGHVADLIAAGVAVAVVWRGYGLALIPLATLLGCICHVAADAMTDKGVPLLWPVSSYHFKLWPEPLAFSTGTRPELLIIDPLAVLAFIALASWAVMPGFDMAAWAHLAHFASTL
jgi:membrane-bound metal-dependent hydrolase YbcI (DUF457 family)